MIGPRLRFVLSALHMLARIVAPALIFGAVAVWLVMR